ncbi:MAG: hypothetical protein EYC70_05165 [Planctomycetota bacterium]|nr:MAG: hypothetical protein EYC70_05165 [Planctomycetota bacterium]
MKTSTLLILGAAALAAPAFGQSAAPGAAAPAALRDGPRPCEAAARAAREATLRQADVAFWLELAACFNDSAGDLAGSAKEALEERAQARALAGEQYQGRLEACAALGHGTYEPQVDPGEFSPHVTNPWFPLVPGRTLVYEQRTAEGLERVEVTVLHQVVEIAGVRCRSVREVETLDGVVFEDTVNWYAQHLSGDVWYFGEVAQHFEDGFLESLEGSWRAGVNGAQPGIMMPAAPAIGAVYRQEYLINVAEDIVMVSGLDETVTVPLGTATGCARISEWSPLEPKDNADKYVDPGVGIILEVNTRTGERLELVEIR